MQQYKYLTRGGIGHSKWPMRAGDFLKLFDVEGTKAPKDKQGCVVHQGVVVFLLPSAPSNRRKSSAHRVFAICPECEKPVPVGRLNQHAGTGTCKSGKYECTNTTMCYHKKSA